MSDFNTSGEDSLSDEGPSSSPSPTGLGALSTLAYGGMGGSPLAAMPEILSKVLPRDRSSNSENMAFWGGVTDPDKNPGANLALGVGNGIRAQVEQRMEQDKLRAAYMPLIMQSIIQGQQMTLMAAQATRAWQKDLNPEYSKWMSGLRTGNNVPTWQEAVQHLAKWADMNGLPPGMMSRYAEQIPRDPASMKKYLDGLILSQKPEAALPTTATNASGQTIGVTPALGTAEILGPGNVGPTSAPAAPATAVGPGNAGPVEVAAPVAPVAPGQAAPVNPSKNAVEFAGKAAGDPGKFGEALQANYDNWHGLTQRMNAQAEIGQAFQTGRYAKTAGGVAAAVSDISSRLGLDPKKVEPIVSRLLGAQPGSKEALAAQQAFDQLTQQDVLFQLRSALGNGQRLNQQEYSAFKQAFSSSSLDPESFNLMRQVALRRLQEAGNKQSAWDGYLKSASNPSVHDFAANYGVIESAPQLQGHDQPPAGPMQAAEHPANQLPTTSERATGAEQTTLQPGVSGTQKLAPNGPGPKGPVDLTKYEKGSFVGPTGKVLIKDPKARLGYRLAQQK